MGRHFLGFFSGFPNYRFPADVGTRLAEELTCRSSLVFVSAWPEEYAKNDRDADGMHGMFEEYKIPFARHEVIDRRMEAAQAKQLLHEASCVFLMGGHPGLQRELIRDMELGAVICGAAAVLGVSAGAINMAKRSLDTKESPVPYEGLGLADITVKPHFRLEDQEVLSTLLQISLKFPICALEDESAIFVTDGRITYTGRIHWISGGEIRPFRKNSQMKGIGTSGWWD